MMTTVRQMTRITSVFDLAHTSLPDRVTIGQPERRHRAGARALSSLLPPSRLEELRHRYNEHLQARIREGYKRIERGFLAQLMHEFRLGKDHANALLADLR